VPTVSSVTLTGLSINTTFRAVVTSQMPVVANAVANGVFEGLSAENAFAMVPGETLTLSFTVAFTFSATTNYAFEFFISAFEPCTPYYYGNPASCSAATEGSKIARGNFGLSPPETLSFGLGGQCSDQCAASSPTPPGGSPTPPTTPVSVTPAPTPGPTAASSGVQTEFKSISANLLPDRGGLNITAISSFSVGSFETIVFTAAGNKTFECSPLCNIGTNQYVGTGGIAFYDNNFDGVYSGNDTLIQGLVIHAIATSAQTDVASTITDVNGVYQFTFAQLANATNSYIFRVNLAYLPTGFTATIVGTANPFLDNVFFGSPPQTKPFVFNAIHPPINLGLAPRSHCKPDNAPMGTTGEQLLPSPVACSTCNTETFVGQCNDLVCPPSSTVRRVVDVPMGLRNRGPGDLAAHTLTMTLEQSPGNAIDAQLICSDVESIVNDNGTLVLQTRPGVQSGSKSHPTRITYGIQTLKTGHILALKARFVFCASSTQFEFNVTTQVQTNACTQLLVNYTNCVAPNIDFTQCYQQQNYTVTSLPCGTACAPTPPTSSSRTLKPPKTPSPTPPTLPTLGPPGESTGVAMVIANFRETRACVMKQLLKPQQCDDSRHRSTASVLSSRCVCSV
jgi:hypothetical protein